MERRFSIAGHPFSFQVSATGMHRATGINHDARLRVFPTHLKKATIRGIEPGSDPASAQAEGLNFPLSLSVPYRASLRRGNHRAIPLGHHARL